MMERSSYSVNDNSELPSLTLTSNLGVNELPPLPAEHSYNYQEFLPELERWTIFRSLPMMVKYDE